MQKDIDGLF